MNASQIIEKSKAVGESNGLPVIENFIHLRLWVHPMIRP